MNLGSVGQTFRVPRIDARRHLSHITSDSGTLDSTPLKPLRWEYERHSRNPELLLVPHTRHPTRWRMTKLSTRTRARLNLVNPGRILYTTCRL